jgi:mannosyltransferase OCH1-like enzyme
MAQAQRNHEAASDHYRAAIAEGGEEVEWLERLAESRLILADVDGAKAALAASIKADAARRMAGGRSTNVSQHHLAQVMEEFLLDPPALEKMRAIAKLPAEAQIEPLAALARRNPNNTGPALLLLNAMRRTGKFDRATIPETGERSPVPAIPRRIVQYWRQPQPPEDVARLIATWRDANPDFEHVLLNEAGAEERLKAYGDGEALEAYRLTREIPQKADILRLAVLAFEGGFFLDADDRCLKPLATHVPPGATFVAYQERLGGIGSNFIGAAKGHPTIVLALAEAAKAINRGDRDMAWLSTGAGLLTRALAQGFATEKPPSLAATAILSAELLNGAVGAYCPAAYKR